MTGIFGAIGEIAPPELDEMGARLAHRGARARWWRVADGVHLGQVSDAEPRLSSIGCISGVVDRLTTLGAMLDDREILQAYIRGGIDGLDQSALSFAFAAWNSETQTLLLGRDLAGLRPLFFTRLDRGAGIAFASEYKGLLAIAAVTPRADLDAIQYLQVFKLAPPESATLLENVVALPPGTVRHFDRDGRELTTEAMRPIALRVDLTSEADAVIQLREHLVAATARLVGNRERIALALSGGIDSLGLAHLCRKVAPDAEIAGFTFTQGKDDPETPIAAMAMRELGGSLHTIASSPQDLEQELPTAVWHLEDPIGRSESYLFFAVAKAARQQGFHALLSGMGADALFAGMPRYKVLWLADLLPWLRGDLLEFFDTTQSGRRSRRPLARVLSRWYYRRSAPPSIPQVRGTHDPEPEKHVAPGPEYLNRALLVDLLDHAARSLPRIERPLAAYGLEHGTPFYDRQVLDLSFRIPSTLKIRRGKEKYVLRRALQGLMTERLANTHKGLMRIRQGNELATALHALAEKYLSTQAVEQRGWFTQESVAAVRDASRDPQCHHEAAMRLWTLLLTEIWGRVFLDARGSRPPS